MSEYQKQAAFLKSLMRYEDNAEHRLLAERLSTAERNERCLLGACRLVSVIALFGLAGLGYSAVLLPQFFDNSTHTIVQFFGALGLGSLMCLLVFGALWLWYRGTVNRIHEECRHLITSMIESRLSLPTSTFNPVVVDDPQSNISVTRTAVQSCHLELLNLPKAS
jgi:hypothetical protein